MEKLEIVVCIKSVPDPREKYESRVDPDTGVVQRQADNIGIPRVISPLDRNALEEALRIKDKWDVKITVFSMDTPAAESVLRETIALGADQAILLSDPAMAGADTLATARTLSAAVKKLNSWDLILCGAWNYHGNTGQTGVQLANFLEIPHLSYASKLDLISSSKLKVKTLWDGKYIIYEAAFPLLVTVLEDINTPRQASLGGILNAREKEVICWTCDDLDLSKDQVGIEGSPSKVTGVKKIDLTRKKEILKGDPKEKVQKLINELRKEAVL